MSTLFKICFGIAAGLEFIFVPWFLKASRNGRCTKSQILKTICATLFVAAGVLASVIAQNRSDYAHYILIGLLLGWCGHSPARSQVQPALYNRRAVCRDARVHARQGGFARHQGSQRRARQRSCHVHPARRRRFPVCTVGYDARRQLPAQAAPVIRLQDNLHRNIFHGAVPARVNNICNFRLTQGAAPKGDSICSEQAHGI